MIKEGGGRLIEKWLKIIGLILKDQYYRNAQLYVITQCCISLN